MAIARAFLSWTTSVGRPSVESPCHYKGRSPEDCCHGLVSPGIAAPVGRYQQLRFIERDREFLTVLRQSWNFGAIEAWHDERSEPSSPFDLQQVLTQLSGVTMDGTESIDVADFRSGKRFSLDDRPSPKHHEEDEKKLESIDDPR
jgi:hypothetical protein